MTTLVGAYRNIKDWVTIDRVMHGIKVLMATNLATHRIEPDPERAPIIVKRFQWYASGQYSLKELTTKAAAVGLTNRTGGFPLVKAKIHQLLQKPIYDAILATRTVNMHSPAS